MATLRFRLGFDLKDHSLAGPVPRQGPLFHRWLPNGKKDAIRLATNKDEPQAELRVWFERRGSVQGGFIEYDPKARGVDRSIMVRQAALDGGHLHVELLLPREPQTVVREIRELDGRLRLGKRAITLIEEPVLRFVKTIKCNFGQYWLRVPSPWDSREQSLGAYFSAHQTRYRLSQSKWKEFALDQKIVHLSTRFGKTAEHEKYLGRADWTTLGKLSQKGHQPSLAAELHSNASRLLGEGRYRHAIVEAVTALEVAVGELWTKAEKSDKILKNAGFGNKNLPAKVLMAAALVPESDPECLREAITGIDLRNKLVHDGKELPPDQGKAEGKTLQCIEALLTVTAVFEDEPVVRLTAVGSNELYKDKNANA